MTSIILRNFTPSPPFASIDATWLQNRFMSHPLEIRCLGTGPGEERGINRDLGDYVNTTQWNNLFPHINNDENADVKTFEYLTSELSDVR